MTFLIGKTGLWIYRELVDEPKYFGVAGVPFVRYRVHRLIIDNQSIRPNVPRWPTQSPSICPKRIGSGHPLLGMYQSKGFAVSYPI